MALSGARVKIPHRVRSVSGSVVRRSSLRVYVGGLFDVAVYPTRDAPSSENVEQPLLSLQDGSFPGYVAPGRYTVSIDGGPQLVWDAVYYGIDWRNPTFQNGWTNYGAGYANVQYGQDPYGVVHIRGIAKSGTLGSTIFTLPVGWRPEAAAAGPAQFPSATGVGPANITISNTGAVVAPSTAGSNALLPLGGINYPADA